MTYFKDLEPYSSRHGTKVLAIGWLESDQPYTRGHVAFEVQEALEQRLSEPFMSFGFNMGMHDCSLCTNKGTTAETPHGTGELYVAGEDVIYVCPGLIAHYIADHGYAPPAEFCAAILHCPPRHSAAYIDALKRVVPTIFDGPTAEERAIAQKAQEQLEEVIRQARGY